MKKSWWIVMLAVLLALAVLAAQADAGLLPVLEAPQFGTPTDLDPPATPKPTRAPTRRPTFATVNPANFPVTTPLPAGLTLDTDLADRKACIVDLVADPDAQWAFAEGVPVLEMVFPQIGMADACILRLDGKVIMIDAGGTADEEQVAQALSLMGVTEIEYGINTHPHHDHLPGFALLKGKARLKKLLVAFTEYSTQHNHEAFVSMCEQGVTVETIDNGSQLTFAGVGETIDVMRRYDESLGVNDRSLVIKVSYGRRSILLMADIESKGQEILQRTRPACGFSADIVKWPHHGINQIRSKLMSMIQPVMALVTNDRADARSGISQIAKEGLPAYFTTEAIYRLRTDGVIWVLDTLSPDAPV